ncbi:Calx-beta domain-containing protein [Plantactinospora sp. GCM10030261]|uniref:Calx-beta domain-containing protein n=1 Tax=Plantactinospora sp. GCM10030261 TaxID=3273420 RepID=UPI0036194C94
MIRLVAVVAVLVPAVVVIPRDAAAVTDICAPRSVGVDDVEQPEGGPFDSPTITFTVSTAGCAGATVRYRTRKATPVLPPAHAGADYVTASGLLTWAPGDTTHRTVTVPIVGDTAAEPDEAFALELYDPVGLLLTDPEGVGTIRDDDPTIVVFGKPYCLEICVTCRLRVVTSEPVSVDLTIRLVTRDGTATAGADYRPVHDGTLTIRAGTSAAEYEIGIHDDQVAEDTETFLVQLSAPSAGEIAEDLVTVGVVDDD